MRKQFVKTVSDLMDVDPKLSLILGDIGVFGFKDVFLNHPSRAYNIGILEQSTVSMAAGFSSSGLIPIIHTIAPFLVERCYEQIKIDFAYQKLKGNFVSVGNSYDYAALGCTHHCPADVGVLKLIPNLQIVLPGTSDEFDKLFKSSYNNEFPTYYRLSERENKTTVDVEFGKASILKKGSKATVVVVGNVLDMVIEACAEFDVNIIYYTTIEPFDKEVLRKTFNSNKFLIIEPYYSGALLNNIIEALGGESLCIQSVGVPLSFISNYGKSEEHDQLNGMNAKNVKEKLSKLISQ
jgi:transketolase